MDNHKAVAFDSIIATGINIDEDLSACPQLYLLLEAVLQCEPEYAITQLTPEKLKVAGNDFQAYIDCLKPELLSWSFPDAAMVGLDDRLIPALKKVVTLVNPVGETVLEQSVQLNAGSCLSSDRTTILEAWHGQNLPDGMLLPKCAITALVKAKKPLKAFGYSGKTATFYFQDDSWIRTQLYQDQWPAVVKNSLNCRKNPRAVPPKLFEACDKVSPFSIDGRVYVCGDQISSHPFGTVQEGSALKLPIGSTHLERSYPIHCMDIASKYAVLWDEAARLDATYFEGENIRGIISHQTAIDNDDDIPF